MNVDIFTFDVASPVPVLEDIAGSLGDVAGSLGRLADWFVPTPGTTPPDVAYQDAVAAPMLLVGRDVTIQDGVGDEPLLAMHGELTVPACVHCGSPRDLDAPTLFKLTRDDERVGELRVGRDAVIGVEPEESGCVIRRTHEGPVVVDARDCDHDDEEYER
jgi:hypothetical protein